MLKISLLGSTGSIGRQTLDIAERYPELIRVKSLAAGKNIKGLADQIRRFRPERVAIKDEGDIEGLLRALHDLDVRAPEILSGGEALIELATNGEMDILINALVGFVGLEPTIRALEAGTDVALANKETLVAGGAFVMEAAERSGSRIYPIDSEHSAIWQCLKGEDRGKVGRIILTASGGPFREYSIEEMRDVSVNQALSHPNWKMGAKITVDSATMMNKALEIIEASWLFGIGGDRIDVVIHPQSIVHSMVEFVDGVIMAQLSHPDMHLPILHALLGGSRIDYPAKPLDLASLGSLIFEEPDPERFPALELGYRAVRAGGSIPVLLNGANEVAVQAFLNGRITFLEIADIVAKAMESYDAPYVTDLSDIIRADRWAREFAAGLCR